MNMSTDSNSFDFWEHLCAIDQFISTLPPTITFKTDLKETLELPEWYNTERDQTMVKEYVNEYDVFYNPDLTIEEELENDLNDITPEQDNETSDEESDNEWIMA